MGLFSLLEATVKVVTLPVTVALDVLDPDVVFDEKKSLTKKTMESIAEDIDSIAD